MRQFTLLFVLALFAFSVHAQNPIIAKQDFDSPLNLASSSSNPALNSFSNSADGFGVYQRGGASTIPFALLDDSNCGFSTDDQGIIGCNKTDAWFGAADTQNGDNPGGTVTASWTFDINNATSLSVEIDMGAMGDFESSDFLEFTYSIDGGTPQSLFSGSTDEAGSLLYTLESGMTVNLDDPYVMEGVTLSNNLTKLTQSIAGTGSQVTITFSGSMNGGDEAFAFDNICIRGQESTGGGGGTCQELFISEYVEGSGSNKYIEIYNPTSSAVDLSDYELRLYSNGASSPNNTNTLSGSLAPGDVVVYRNSSATIYTGPSIVASAVNFNGDDAIALYNTATGMNADIFGRIGEDPGSQWNVSGNGTQNQTLVRSSSVTAGVMMNPSSGFPTLGAEWTEFSQNDIHDLGQHTADGCGTVTPPTCQITNVTITNLACGDAPFEDRSFFDISFDVTGGSGTQYNILNPANSTSYSVIPTTTADGNVMGTGSASSAATPGTMAQVIVRDANNSSCVSTPVDIFVPICPSCSAGPGDLVISEIMQNPGGSIGDNDGEYFEVYNPTGSPINMNGIVIRDADFDSHTISSSVVVPAGGYIVLARNANTAVNGGLPVAYEYGSDIALANGGDEVILECNGTVIDAVFYDGGPDFPDPNGASMNLNPSFLDAMSNDDGANWCESTSSYTGDNLGTPGAPNDGCGGLPAPYEFSAVGCNGLSEADFDAMTQTFELSTTCQKTGFNADRGAYVTATACGNFVFDAKLESLFPSNAYAGITVRESLAPGAKKFSIIQYPGNGRKNVEYRVATNGNYQVYWNATWTVGMQYLRIERMGNYFFGYASITGAPGSYGLMFMAIIPMNPCVETGMVVSAALEGQFSSAVFSNVSLSSMAFQVSSGAANLNGQQGDTALTMAGAPAPSSNALGQFQVFPNPVTSELNVSFEDAMAEEATIRILSMDGRNVYENVHGIQGATVNIPLSQLNMTEGMYLLQVATGEEVRTERFVKVNR